MTKLKPIEQLLEDVKIGDLVLVMGNDDSGNSFHIPLYCSEFPEAIDTEKGKINRISFSRWEIDYFDKHSEDPRDDEPYTFCDFSSKQDGRFRLMRLSPHSGSNHPEGKIYGYRILKRGR
ncbi:MAG: hypothetical protein PHH54_02345 [Candidatus Nanoarchaeia archaeon]|nr:hypothetical protein [Candidatus Nanoarchaeia archaeon]MDD5740802.1 hypothetical protein [Candidatus Nanoarchaeia archaeon]